MSWTRSDVDLVNNYTSARNNLRMAILGLVEKHPGIDSEELAKKLRVPFPRMDEEVAYLCEHGVLSKASR